MDYTRLDDDKFEITQPSTTQISVAALQDEIASLQARIDVLVGHLQGAANAGVASAQPVLDAVAAQPLSPTLAKAAPMQAQQVTP